MTTGQPSRTDPDPFRRPPLIDIPWGERQRWWDRTTRRLDERRLWREARTWRDLTELSARFCEGQLQETPGHCGPRAEETVRVAKPLAHANRCGFLTTGSQPGELSDSGHQQRAFVDGWAHPKTVQQLKGLVRGTRLVMRVTEHLPRRRKRSDEPIDVTRHVYPNGDIWVHTGVGGAPPRNTIGLDYDRPDLVEGAAYVQIHDPEWGDHRLLWDRLAEPDWDNPTPPSAPPTRPTAAPTSTGSAGGAMSSIEEVRAGIAAANESATEGLGALQQAHASLEQAQAGLMAATEGSGQADVSEANGLLAQAVGSIEETRQQVAAAISAAEGVGNRL